MGEQHEFERSVARAWEPGLWSDTTVLVAVSGGADSVALLLALWGVRRQGSGKLMVAHFNHCLRGADSDADEQFVDSLGRRLGLTVEMGRARQPITPGGDGIEAGARDQRYQFLREVADRAGARYVVTAHTANDQAETLLHRIVRGTGVAGLAGIPFTRTLSAWTSVVRPLLGITRSQVLSYLTDRQQSFREDRSNQQSEFTRNRIRHQLLPLLEHQFNPQVIEALVRLGTLAEEAQGVIAQLASQLLDAAIITHRTDHVELAPVAFAGQSPYLVREMLVQLWSDQGWPRQAMGADKWRQLGGLLTQAEPAASRLTLPGGIDLQLAGGRWILRRDGL